MNDKVLVNPLVQGVPKTQYASNSQPIDMFDQYKIQATRQFNTSDLVTSTADVIRIKKIQSFYLYKILITGLMDGVTVGSISTLNLSNDGNNLTISTLQWNGVVLSNGSGSPLILNLDFNPPIYIDTKGGARYLRFNFVGVNGTFYVQFYCFESSN